jgi:hypothetical protein
MITYIMQWAHQFLYILQLGSRNKMRMAYYGLINEPIVVAEHVVIQTFSFALLY